MPEPHPPEPRTPRSDSSPDATPPENGPISMDAGPTPPDDEAGPSLGQATAHALKEARRLVVGEARNPLDPRVFHQLSLIAFFAWVGLGADGLSSSAYGPEEAYLAI